MANNKEVIDNLLEAIKNAKVDGNRKLIVSISDLEMLANEIETLRKKLEEYAHLDEFVKNLAKSYKKHSLNDLDFYKVV